MKTDNYLSLCLEQAAKSPLHYRHGAIVVRGGKVIGHGHNDYRSGFNGGALKNGRIASGGYDGAAIAELKKKLKGKQKCKQQQQQQSQQDSSSSTFVPFENTNAGGGHSVNQPLSMHSEMMAIYSALNASSTLSSTTFSREKLCFKLPRADKRKARLRRAVLEAYVKAVCQTSAGTGKLQVQLEYNSNNDNLNKNDNHSLAAPTLAQSSVVFHEQVSGHHHHQNRKNEKRKNGKKNEYQYQYQYGRYGQAKCSSQPSVSELETPSAARSDDGNVTREHEYMITNDDEHDVTNTATTPGHFDRNSKRKKDYKRSGKMRSTPITGESEQPPQPLLIPTGRAVNTNDRKQHSRLQGADLYVVRIGWSGKPLYKPGKAKAPKHESATAHEADDIADDAVTSSVSSLSPLSIASASSSTGSLHDELINREPSPSSRPLPSTAMHDCSFDRDKIHASRPCYRCVAFMSHVGIRRVFWTNDAGEWEGGKVATLIDAMDAGMDDAAKGGPTGNGVFVTKHEVLMLRRMMGAKAST
ncbi:Putative cytidine deaminase [Septoria linicola]|uniref:Cytidine deaminase n=1 Tax=Septoria linicola TaxID=215465 RepID=A0A9Q9ATL5_9PEZI|nr:Putative cytidine deaminase [Septoria linicola]